MKGHNSSIINGTNIWRGVCTFWESMKPNLVWRIGNGNSTFFGLICEFKLVAFCRIMLFLSSLNWSWVEHVIIMSLPVVPGISSI